jgi:flagellar biosynthesis chaperone FliJ
MSEKRRLQQLAIIRDLKIQQEQALAKQLAVAYQAWQHQLDTLKQLQGYQQEYASGLQQNTQPWSRQNLQGFLTQLEQVLVAQTQQLAQAELLHKRVQQQWQATHHHAQRFAEYVAEQNKHFIQEKANKQDIEAQALFGLTQKNSRSINKI